MRVRGGIAVVKTLSLLLLSSQSAAVWAQSPSPQLAPVVLRPMDGKNAPALPSVNEVAAKSETTQASLTSAGIPLQPMIPTSSPSSPSLPVGPILQDEAGPLPTVPPEAWGPGVALQPISRNNESPAVPHLANVPFAVLPMTKYDSSGDPISTRTKLTTDAMTGPMKDPISMFQDLKIVPAPQGALASPVRSHQDTFAWAPDTYTWYSPVFSHRPLYFEQPNLERYGMGTRYYLQPLVSSAHFFTSAAIMPYKVLTQHPNEHVYTLGHGRPGNCEPFQGRAWLGQSTIGEACKVYDPYSGY